MYVLRNKKKSFKHILKNHCRKKLLTSFISIMAYASKVEYSHKSFL